jgi:hypothetical protein
MSPAPVTTRGGEAVIPQADKRRDTTNKDRSTFLAIEIILLSKAELEKICPIISFQQINEYPCHTAKYIVNLAP